MNGKRTLAVIIIAMVAVAACAAKPRDSGKGTNVDRRNRASFGADVVAYFSLETDARSVAGKGDFSYDWNGARWLFSSQENLEAFKAEPERFAPQYGGYCSFAMSEDKVVESDPNAWAIRDGKLHLFYRKKGRSNWRESPDELVSLADGYWPPHLEALVEDGEQ